MKSRAEHMAWCKKRALEYLDAGDLNNAVTSMLSDLGKHPDTERLSQGVLAMLGMQAMMQQDNAGARRFIEGFN